MLTKPVLIERIKRTNITIVNLQQQQAEFMLRCDLYTIEINRGRNCYNYKEFRYIMKYCRNLLQKSKVYRTRKEVKV